MKPIDMRPVYRKYKGLWVALKDNSNKVIAFGKTRQVAEKKAKEMGYELPGIIYVPKQGVFPSLGVFDLLK